MIENQSVFYLSSLFFYFLFYDLTEVKTKKKLSIFPQCIFLCSNFLTFSEPRLRSKKKNKMI